MMLLPQLTGQSASRLVGDVLQPGGQQPSIDAPPQASVAEHLALHVDGEPVYVSQHRHADAVGQLEGGSHVSPALMSTNPSPQPAQSESCPGAHPIGQHWSMPALEQVFGVCVQTTLQVEALPLCVSVVQLFASLQFGHVPGGSHVSPASRRPLPHPEQSVSDIAVQPAGQQLSLFVPQAIMPASTHCRWHAVPCSARIVQPRFGHVVGQLAPSHSSPGSSTPLPHTAEQLLSFTALHPVGQHASSFTQLACGPDVWHCA
jgi:hypothetical protein